jgi:hypothetical protein
MPFSALIGGIASIGGSVIGAVAGSGDQQAARAAALAAFQQYANLGIPPNMAQPLVLQNLKSQGVLTPQLQQEINLGPSQLANIHQNQADVNAQQSALSSLIQQGAGGMTPQEKAAFIQMQGSNLGAANAQRQSILQQAQQQGIADSGTKLAAQLQAGQSGANNALSQGNQLASLSNQNALAAMSQAGQLGGQMNQQQYNIAANAAQAQDTINRFNAQNALGIQQANVGANNQAQAQNLANAQAISNYNAQQANQEQLRELQGQQLNWQNQVGLAGAKAGALLGQSGYLQGQGQQTANQFQNIGQGVAQTANAYGTAQNQQNFQNFLQNQYGNNSPGTTNTSASQYNFQPFSYNSTSGFGSMS